VAFAILKLVTHVQTREPSAPESLPGMN
jgi:hypothetical protein